MMQRWFSNSAQFSGVATVLLAMGLVGCSQSESAQTNGISGQATVPQPQVVATTSVLCDLTRQVAADSIALTCLLQPGQDPHTFQARPSNRQAIDDADLVLYDGFGFVPTVAGLVTASRTTAPKVAVFEVAVPEPLMGQGHDHDHRDGATPEASHDPTDVADLVPDPHIWHNASHNAAVVKVIATNLARVNPDQADLYQKNAAQLSAQFTELDSWIHTQVDTVPVNHRRLVTTHDAFRYFADAYGFDVNGALSGLSTAEKPSAGSLTALVEQVKETSVPAIFAESTTNPELINTVANDASVEVAKPPLLVEGPAGPGSNAETTQEMLVNNTCTIVNALGGSCNQVDAPI